MFGYIINKTMELKKMMPPQRRGMASLHKSGEVRRRRIKLKQIEWLFAFLLFSTTAFSLVFRHYIFASTANEEPEGSIAQTLAQPNHSPKFAYAFVVGGCDPSTRAHWSFLFNIMVATEILRERGSKADFVVLLQMKQSTNLRRLPRNEARWLATLNITSIYIPPTKEENFYSTMMDKFRILGLTAYDRVLYMDSDVMPVANLDYLMEMSHNGILQENFVIQGRAEPANGGFFMVRPYASALDEINELIKDRTDRGRTMGPPYFDESIGWGHTIKSPDFWEGFEAGENGTLWDFWAAFADQGLLYHWTKYHRKSVSIATVNINGTKSPVQSWAAVGGDEIRLIESYPNLFDNVSNPLPAFARGSYSQRPPISDFVHFTGRAKPWLTGLTKLDKAKLGTPNRRYFWFDCLMSLDKRLGIGLNFDDWHSNGISLKGTLGSFPKLKQAVLSTPVLKLPDR